MWGWILSRVYAILLVPESPAQNKVRVQGRLEDQRKLLASALSQHPKHAGHSLSADPSQQPEGQGESQTIEN